MNKRATQFSVLAVVLLALALRISAAAYWHRTAESEGHLFRLGDSHSYWTLAGQIARGLPYQYGSANASVFRAPVYPLVLAPLTLVANEQAAVWGARLLGCVLGSLSVALIMSLTRSLVDSTCGSRLANRAMLCSGLLAAVYPGAIGMSVVILSEAVFCPLMLVYFLCWQQGWKTSTQSRRWALGVGAGCAAGLAVLARPSWLLFAPFVFVIGITFGPQRARHTTIFIATLAGMVLTMSPWWVRNASVTGEFVLTTLQVGPSLYDGMHDGATGASDEGMAFMSRFAEEQLAEDATGSSLRSAFECSTFEYRLNRRAQRAAIEWMVTHPADVALLAWRKFLRTWSLWPNGGEVGSSTLRLLLTVGCFGVLALACVGSQSSWPLKLQLQVDGTSATFYWLPTAYFTLLHMIFVGSIRYREPALLVLTILAGIGLAKLTGRLMKNAAD